MIIQNNKKLSAKKYRDNNKEKINKYNKEYNKNYYRANSDKEKTRTKNWRNNNIASYLLTKSKTRNTPNTLTIEQIQQKLENIYRNGSYYCPILNIKLSINQHKICDNSFTIDRISNKEYTFNNINIISHKANRIKGNITLDFAYKLREYFALASSNNLPIQKDYYIVNEKFRKYKYKNLKSNANKKHIPFSLTPEDLIFPNIDFFGFPISIEKNCPRNQQLSCDRIIYDGDYSKDNIYWISMKANIMKKNINPEILETLIKYMEG